MARVDCGVMKSRPARARWIFRIGVAALALLAGGVGGAESAGAAPGSAGSVGAAVLRYGTPERTSQCFSSHFLRILALETTIEVDQELASVELASPALFEHPFVIMTGEGVFDLSAAEVEQLRAYVLGGGFVLASAGCSSDPWNASLERAIALALPDHPLVALDLDHPVFHTVFDIKDFSSRRRQAVRMQGVEVGDRLAVVYSAQGLNDTKNAGGRCCCCTGDELVSAAFINANVLAYAVLR